MSSLASDTAARPRRRFTRPVPVSVNGVAISSAAIARETQHHATSDPDEAWTLAARALVVRELLRQEADRLGLVAEPVEDGEGRRETDEEARLRGVLDREVRVPRADEAACRRYYDSNPRRFRSPDLAEAAHILLAAAPRDEAARAAARETAAALIAELRRHPERFAVLAAQHSACSSAAQAGNLGQIGPGQTVPEFESVLARLAVGLATEPVETRYGVHVVRLDRRIEGRPLPFEMVRQRIADYLDERVQRQALRQYLTVLAGRATLTGIDFAGASGPLVQ